MKTTYFMQFLGQEFFPLNNRALRGNDLPFDGKAPKCLFRTSFLFSASIYGFKKTTKKLMIAFHAISLV